MYLHSRLLNFLRSWLLTGLTGPKYASFAPGKDPRSDFVKRKVFCRHLFVFWLSNVCHIATIIGRAIVNDNHSLLLAFFSHPVLFVFSEWVLLMPYEFHKVFPNIPRPLNHRMRAYSPNGVSIRQGIETHSNLTPTFSKSSASLSISSGGP